MDPMATSGSVDDDGFEVIDNKELPIRSGLSTATTIAAPNPHGIDIQVHPLPNKKSMIVSVHPPLKPVEDIPHVPCDIVLCIDVSGSMKTDAPLPTTDESGQKEVTGLSVLDLTKHAAKTVLETLNEKDRLGLVTFSDEATVVCALTYMTKENKDQVQKKISELYAGGITNLYHGMKTGLQMLRDSKFIPENIQALHILTDGLPNHMCPRQGYIPKLRNILRSHQKKLPLIHTFGFGYYIRSGLLQAIAEVGGGTYGFIPDAGMIGTVFVHSIANLYTTFATHATLKLRSSGATKLTVAEGSRTGIQLDETSPAEGEVSIRLGNLQYGQSRDILVHFDAQSDKKPTVQASLSYNFRGEMATAVSTDRLLTDPTSLPVSVCDYHVSRAMICALLRKLYPVSVIGEYKPLDHSQLNGPRSELQSLVADVQRFGHKDDQNTSLLHDLCGDDPYGQVSLAIGKDDYFEKWGKHYLLSLLNAHTYQICNSFKDPGPLAYGKDSPFFCKCRDELDECFDNLPAPQPSNLYPTQLPAAPGQYAPVQTNSAYKTNSFSMSRYNRRSDPCFAGHCIVRLAEGKGSIPVRNLCSGMAVWTPSGSRRVKAVVATKVADVALCKIGSLWITPWHPMQSEGGRWVFPREVAHEVKSFSGTIYSVLLVPNGATDAHAMMVGGQVCVTLGHGVIFGTDVRAHPFLGNYRQVAKSLALLPRDSSGILRSGGIRRDPKTRLAAAFIAPRQRRQHLQPRIRVKIIFARRAHNRAPAWKSCRLAMF
ncbi:hypothetical protein AJ80_03411 [Polytolypa hystricis UAMH7299]|uniref:VWFA domain-containing protein n=1 Tax=Polytolypa hystricis (strain UAMH7299) TaxID=1447883 RepID=A0A2B7Y9P1_POLH7|nr:hypothetical protein AJ80_03411 [Polytolypa hystricis UAMH7299]